MITEEMIIDVMIIVEIVNKFKHRPQTGDFIMVHAFGFSGLDFQFFSSIFDSGASTGVSNDLDQSQGLLSVIIGNW